MATRPDRSAAGAVEEGVSVTRCESHWLVRMETARTIQEYRCGTEAQARRLAATLSAGLRREAPPRPGARSSHR